MASSNKEGWIDTMEAGSKVKGRSKWMFLQTHFERVKDPSHNHGNHEYYFHFDGWILLGVQHLSMKNQLSTRPCFGLMNIYLTCVAE
jgi:hypothetical protein